jgi:very-short-patch-repair endonuclease
MAAALHDIARRQGGVFTLRQARQLGVSPEGIQRRLLSGDWLPVFAGVVRAAGAPVSAEMKSWAAVLALGQPAALTGQWAAAALGLDRAPAAGQPQLAIPANRFRRVVSGLEIRRVAVADWSSWTVSWRRGLPFAPLPVVLRDLAREVPHDVVRDVVQHALRRRLLTVQELTGALRRGAGGSARLRGVLEELAPGYQVHWERLLHRALARRGVAMTPQVEVRAPDGRVGYLDLGREDLRFGVEIDGFLNHMERFAADRRRMRMLAVEMGWTIAPYAVEEIRAGLDRIADEIARFVRDLVARAARAA